MSKLYFLNLKASFVWQQEQWQYHVGEQEQCRRPERCTGSRLRVHGFYKSKNYGEKVSNNFTQRIWRIRVELSSTMTNHNSFQLNESTIFSSSFSFHSVSGPAKHLLKITFFLHPFLISDLTFREKCIILILIYHSSYVQFLETFNSHNPLCWIRCTFQVAHEKQKTKLRLHVRNLNKNNMFTTLRALNFFI